MDRATTSTRIESHTGAGRAFGIAIGGGSAGEETGLGRSSPEGEVRLHKVAVLQDQRSFLWEEALAAWAKEAEQP